MIRGFLRSLPMTETHVPILTLPVLGDLCPLSLRVTCPFLNDDVTIPECSLAAISLGTRLPHKPCPVYFRFSHHFLIGASEVPCV